MGGIKLADKQIAVKFRADSCYWPTENSFSEVDFVLQHSGKVIPLEVKAEENLMAKSLKFFAANNGLPSASVPLCRTSGSRRS